MNPTPILLSLLFAGGVVLIALAAHRLSLWLTADPVLAPAQAPLPVAPSVLVVAGWYHVELAGRGGDISGLVDEVLVAGVPFLRVREADRAGGFHPDRLLAPSAVWRMTPTTEDQCRREVWSRWTPQRVGLEIEDDVPVRSAVVLRRLDRLALDAAGDVDLSGTTVDSEPPSQRMAVAPRDTVADGRTALEDSGPRETVVECGARVRLRSERPTAIGVGSERGTGR